MSGTCWWPGCKNKAAPQSRYCQTHFHQKHGMRYEDVVPPPKTLAQIVEECIDLMEEQGMPLQPWQATAFRAIMLHDGPIRLHGYRS